LPKEKHPVNVLFTRAEHTRLVRWATELTLEEGRRVSVAELVRRLALSHENGLHEGLAVPEVRVGSD
jgi:hypothetical protein